MRNNACRICGRRMRTVKRDSEVYCAKCYFQHSFYPHKCNYCDMWHGEPEGFAELLDSNGKPTGLHGEWITE